MVKNISLKYMANVAQHFIEFEYRNRRKLISWATNPNICKHNAPIRIRQVAIKAIIDSGKIEPSEITPLFNLVKDDFDFPISGKNLDKDTKENMAVLRAEAAIALAKFGEGIKEYEEIRPQFIYSLKEILYEMENDSRFILIADSENYYYNDFKYFLSALYLAERNEEVRKPSSQYYMNKYLIKKESLLDILNIKGKAQIPT